MGANTVKVKVTAEDGNANDTYIVVVTRAAAAPATASMAPAASATIAFLGLSHSFFRSAFISFSSPSDDGAAESRDPRRQ